MSVSLSFRLTFCLSQFHPFFPFSPFAWPVHADLTVCLTVDMSHRLPVCLQDPSIRGIFHFSGKEQMTKYEMAVAMAQAFNLPSNHLIPVSV